jgi:drug/metabolite transporter (DMT)-like permease
VVLGFWIVVLGSFCLALQNVVVRVIFAESSLLGQITWGGLLPPTLGHSLLVLQLRSLLILPAMVLLSYRLYPTTTQSLKHLWQPSQRSTLGLALFGSSALYAALALLFIALASIPAGVATVLFFIHPVITGVLAWGVLGQRPSRLRLLVTLGVLLGCGLVVPSFAGGGGGAVGLGVAAALGASVAYATQSVVAQVCFRHIHPVPYTLINFAVMALLSTLSLGFVHLEVPPGQWMPLGLLSLVSAGLTLLGQLLYNIGIHLVRAASMAIVAVSNPVFTVALGWLVLQESLQLRQLAGIVLVVVSIVTLSQDHARQGDRAST